MDDSKLQPIRDYLHQELPGFRISEKYYPGSETQTFVISANNQSTYLKFQKSFIEYKNIHQIEDMLNKMDIVFLFKQHPDVDIFFISCETNRM